METKAVVRETEAEERIFHGVLVDLLAHGPEAMVTLMHFKRGNHVPPHAHPNTQSGYVVSGRIRLRVAGEVDEVLGPGDAYSIPAGAEHTVDVLESGEVVDVFNPPRADLL
jgi:quercetin dioxygenase-like cupin family protein